MDVQPDLTGLIRRTPSSEDRAELTRMEVRLFCANGNHGKPLTAEDARRIGVALIKAAAFTDQERRHLGVVRANLADAYLVQEGTGVLV